MRLLDLRGRLVNRNVTRFLIDWDKKSRSKFQFRVKQLLKPIWFSHIVFEEFPVFGSLLKIDFYNATKKIALEANGIQHEKFNKFFHNDTPTQWVNSLRRDMQKHEWCEKNDIRLIEIIETDLRDLKQDFYDRIL